MSKWSHSLQPTLHRPRSCSEGRGLLGLRAVARFNHTPVLRHAEPPAANTTAGNTLFMFVRNETAGSTATPSLTDTKGNAGVIDQHVGSTGSKHLDRPCLHHQLAPPHRSGHRRLVRHHALLHMAPRLLRARRSRPDRADADNAATSAASITRGPHAHSAARRNNFRVLRGGHHRCLEPDLDDGRTSAWSWGAWTLTQAYRWADQCSTTCHSLRPGSHHKPSSRRRFRADYGADRQLLVSDRACQGSDRDRRGRDERVAVMRGLEHRAIDLLPVVQEVPSRQIADPVKGKRVSCE